MQYTTTGNQSNNFSDCDAQPDRRLFLLSFGFVTNFAKDIAIYTYHYDYENRLTKIKKSNDTVDVAEFYYDALGRRVKKTDSITSANTRRYYYDYN